MRERVTRAAVKWIADGLSQRDWAIVHDVGRVRVLSGRQVERLHFADLGGAHRDRARRRVLERLVALRLLTPLARRIGGVRAGSAGLVFALGPAGQRLLAIQSGPGFIGRTRQPVTPTERFLAHSLVTSELYVRLVEVSRTGVLRLASFCGEPHCWWQSEEGEWVKPDALAVVAGGEVEDCWAVEVDMATESLPTLKRKLMVYLNLAAGHERGPGGGPLPRVLLSVPDERRLHDVRALIRALPDPAAQLFAVTTHDRATEFMAQMLKE